MKTNLLFRAVLSILFVGNVVLSSITPALGVNKSTPNKIDKMERFALDISKGKKIPLNESLSKNKKNVVANDYLIGVQQSKVSSVINSLKKFPKTKFKTFNYKDETSLVFINVYSTLDSAKVTGDLYALDGVMIVENNVKRESLAVPTLNDPYLPTSNTYDLNKAWYLNQPDVNGKGIDMFRAWEYLDSKGINWSGDENVVVAVLDSGVAYENITKYDTYPKMSSPTSWQFSKGAEVSNNLWINNSEIAGNLADEDEIGYFPWGYLEEDEILYPTLGYCIDNDDDLVCDTDIAGAVFDDVNSFNVVDWDRYWEIDFDEWMVTPYCLDDPQITCMAQNRCDIVGLDNADYMGCQASDMGHANDTNGHGTFVANIINGTENNNNAGVGIAPGVQLMSVKTLGSHWNSDLNSWDDTSTSSTQSVGILWATIHGADVINISSGGVESSYFEYSAIRFAEDSGVVVVAASGNTSTEGILYPAGYPSVLAVGASNVDGTRSTYSSFGVNLDIVAPVEEEGIFSESYTCFNTDECEPTGQTLSDPSQYTQFSTFKAAGTSFAAPQASAVAALVKSLHPSWTPWQIRYAITMSATPIGDGTINSETGFGVLNAYNALRGVDSQGRDLFARDMENSVFNTIYESKFSGGNIYVRKSYDEGATKTAWTKISHTTTYNGNISFNRVQGIDGLIAPRVLATYIGSNKVIYTRYSDDDGITWSTPIGNGYSTALIFTETIGATVIQAAKYYGGIYNNHARVRKSLDGGQTWGSWTGPSLPNSVTVMDFVSMVYVPSSGTLVQAVRSLDNGLWVRNSSNLGDTWSKWTRLAAAYVTPSLAVSGSNMYMSLIGYGGKVLTRVSRDGGLTWDANWILSGYTKGWIYTVPDSFGGVLQAVKWGDGVIYTRRSLDGTTWTAWLKQTLPNSKTAASGVRIHKTNEGAFLSVVSTDGYVYSKRSLDGGVTWTSWVKGYTSTSSYSVFNNKLFNRVYEYAKRSDGYVYSRYTDNSGQTWSTLKKDSTTTTVPSVGIIPSARINVDF